MWSWLEPHDLYWRRVSTRMHSHLHTKDNIGGFTCTVLELGIATPDIMMSKFFRTLAILQMFALQNHTYTNVRFRM